MKTLNKVMSMTPEALVKSGVISCSWVNACDIYDQFTQSKQLSGKSNNEIILEISVKTGQSESTVRQAVYKIKHILE